MDKIEKRIISIEVKFIPALAKVICILYGGPPVRSPSGGGLIALCSLSSVPNLSPLHGYERKKKWARRRLERRRVQQVSVRIMSDQG